MILNIYQGEFIMPLPKRPATFALAVGEQYLQTLDELQNYFFVDDIIKHFKSKRLHSWLKDRHLDEILSKLNEISAYENIIDVVKKMVFVFNIKNIFTTPSKSIDADAYFESFLKANATIIVSSDNKIIDKETVIEEFLADEKNIENIVDKYLSDEDNKEKIFNKYFINVVDEHLSNKDNRAKIIQVEVRKKGTFVKREPNN